MHIMGVASAPEPEVEEPDDDNKDVDKTKDRSEAVPNVYMGLCSNIMM